MPLGYNHSFLFREIESLLAEQPRATLRVLEKQREVERHTISRSVKMKTGLSFREYQHNRLLKKSTELLEIPNLSIKQVAITLGFGHPRDFSRFFRKMTGETPTQFRNRTAVWSVKLPNLALIAPLCVANTLDFARCLI